ncbi:hypothetical protein HDV02_005644 [Globomyces sp. JEL0801]|nr:hypothetical protein HDV02_005644 [Globomyces sp. JEL0801]
MGSNKYPMHVETDIKQLENDIVPPTTTHKPEIGTITKTFSVSHTTLIEDEIAIYDQEKAHLSDSFLREADNQLLLPKNLPQNSPQQLSLDASETIDSSDGYSSYQHSLIPSPTNTSSVQSSVVFEVDDNIQSQNQSISEDFKDQSDCSSMSSWSLNNHVLIDSPILPVTLVSEKSVVLSTNLSESSEWEIPLNSSSN